MYFEKKMELYDERDIAAGVTVDVCHYTVPPKSKISIRHIGMCGDRNLAFLNGAWMILVDEQAVTPFNTFTETIAAPWQPNQLLFSPIELKGGQTFKVRIRNTHGATQYFFVTRVCFDLITEK